MYVKPLISRGLTSLGREHSWAALAQKIAQLLQPLLAPPRGVPKPNYRNRLPKSGTALYLMVSLRFAQQCPTTLVWWYEKGAVAFLTRQPLRANRYLKLCTTSIRERISASTTVVLQLPAPFDSSQSPLHSSARPSRRVWRVRPLLVDSKSGEPR